MKKETQMLINEEVLDAIARFNRETTGLVSGPWNRLRSCSAHVARILHYDVLMSYNTIVAIIDHDTDTLYDFLRYVYGYTSTSAQHISKFEKDYGRKYNPVTGECLWGCTHRYTYKEV